MSLTIPELRERGMKDPIRVIHSLCGAIVFWHDGVLQGKWVILNPDRCILPNGAKPRTDDPIICSFCGYKVQPHQLQFIINDGDTE